MAKRPTLRDAFDVLTMPLANPRTKWDLAVWAVSARLMIRGLLDPNGGPMLAQLANVKRQVEAVHRMTPEQARQVAEAMKKRAEEEKAKFLAERDAAAKANGGLN